MKEAYNVHRVYAPLILAAFCLGFHYLCAFLAPIHPELFAGSLDLILLGNLAITFVLFLWQIDAGLPRLAGSQLRGAGSLVVMIAVYGGLVGAHYAWPHFVLCGLSARVAMEGGTARLEIAGQRVVERAGVGNRAGSDPLCSELRFMRPVMISVDSVPAGSVVTLFMPALGRESGEYGVSIRVDGADREPLHTTISRALSNRTIAWYMTEP